MSCDAGKDISLNTRDYLRNKYTTVISFKVQGSFSTILIAVHPWLMILCENIVSVMVAGPNLVSKPMEWMMNQESKHLLQEKIRWLQKRSAGLPILAAVLDTRASLFVLRRKQEGGGENPVRHLIATQREMASFGSRNCREVRL